VCLSSIALAMGSVVRTRDAGLERDLPNIIRTYNVAVGGVNDDQSGYHETITRAYLAANRLE
ncbi:hypothetical protein, partial [Escherichia coli]|uniref:hypothetical protein n=1 Tax=Escherichia coli TaxID=562 RepID=UPI00195339AC